MRSFIFLGLFSLTLGLSTGCVLKEEGRHEREQPIKIEPVLPKLPIDPCPPHKPHRGDTGKTASKCPCSCGCADGKPCTCGK